MKKKISYIILGFFAVIVFAALAAFVVLRLVFAPYFTQAEKEFSNPVLKDGLVPQGFTYVEGQDVFLECGYMADGESPSRIYVIKDGKTQKYVELYNEDGEPFTGHTGGIAAGEGLLWMANDDDEDNFVAVLDLNEVLKEGVTSVRIASRFFPRTRAACCYVYGGSLWVGEFYREGEYETEPSHHVTLPSGETNPALICAYSIDETKENGIADTLPTAVISVPAQLQGFAIKGDGSVALSTSWGLESSGLYFYNGVLSSEPEGVFEFDGQAVPMWYLSENALSRKVTAPPMSEEIVEVNGRLYVIYESSSRKYIFGIFTRGGSVDSLEF